MLPGGFIFIFDVKRWVFVNSTQKMVFLIGIIAIAWMGMYPPWKEAGPKGLPRDYGAIYAPPKVSDPEKGLEIDFARLLLQIGVAAILTGGLITASSTQKDEGEEVKGQDSNSSKPKFSPVIETSEQEDEEEEEEVKAVPKSQKSSKNTIQFNLPKETLYGEFLVEADDDPDSWEWYADAKGSVSLPKNKPVQLEIVKKEDVDLSFLTILKEDTLHSIDLTNCKINDWELANVSKLTGLKELDLTGTSISSEAMTYVHTLNSLEKLWLDGTKIDDQSIASIGKLTGLKKLSVKKTEISEEGIDKLKSTLENCVVES